LNVSSIKFRENMSSGSEPIRVDR